MINLLNEILIHPYTKQKWKVIGFENGKLMCVRFSDNMVDYISLERGLEMFAEQQQQKIKELENKLSESSDNKKIEIGDSVTWDNRIWKVYAINRDNNTVRLQRVENYTGIGTVVDLRVLESEYYKNLYESEKKMVADQRTKDYRIVQEVLEKNNKLEKRWNDLRKFVNEKSSYSSEKFELIGTVGLLAEKETFECIQQMIYELEGLYPFDPSYTKSKTE